MDRKRCFKSFILLFKEEKYIDNMLNLINVYWSSCQVHLLTFQHSYEHEHYKNLYTLVINLPFNIKWGTFKKNFGKNINNIYYLQFLNINEDWSDPEKIKTKVIAIINSLLDSEILSINIDELIEKENVSWKRTSADAGFSNEKPTKVFRL